MHSCPFNGVWSFCKWKKLFIYQYLSHPMALPKYTEIFQSIVHTSHWVNGTDFNKISPIYTIPKAPCSDTDIVASHDPKRPTILAPILGWDNNVLKPVSLELFKWMNETHEHLYTKAAEHFKSVSWQLNLSLSESTKMCWPTKYDYSFIVLHCKQNESNETEMLQTNWIKYLIIVVTTNLIFFFLLGFLCFVACVWMKNCLFRLTKKKRQIENAAGAKANMLDSHT